MRCALAVAVAALTDRSGALAQNTTASISPDPVGAPELAPYGDHAIGVRTITSTDRTARHPQHQGRRPTAATIAR